MGLVDFIGDDASVEGELDRLLGRYSSIHSSDATLLARAKKETPASSMARAIVLMGGVSKYALKPLVPSSSSHTSFRHALPSAAAEPPLVRLSRPKPGIALLELDDPEHSNAMDERIAAQFAAHVEALKSDKTLRGLIVQGRGAHFCTGINPYSFVKAMQNTTVLDAGSSPPPVPSRH